MQTNATADALQLIKRVLALRKKEPEPAASQSASSGGGIQPAEEALTSDVAVESVEGVAAENVAEQASASLRPDAQGESQIQAGCTALVAIFKVLFPSCSTAFPVHSQTKGIMRTLSSDGNKRLLLLTVAGFQQDPQSPLF